MSESESNSPDTEQWASARLAAANTWLQGEVARLRLTDAEREAVERAADLIDNKTYGDSSTLRGLLERTRNGSLDGRDLVR